MAQVIFSGHPSNTLEKQAPIWNQKGDLGQSPDDSRLCSVDRRGTHQDFRGGGQAVDSWFLKVSTQA